jgi:hypothetical protein
MADLSRRFILKGIPLLIAAPAIVRAASLMPIPKYRSGCELIGLVEPPLQFELSGCGPALDGTWFVPSNIFVQQYKDNVELLFASRVFRKKLNV